MKKLARTQQSYDRILVCVLADPYRENIVEELTRVRDALRPSRCLMMSSILLFHDLGWPIDAERISLATSRQLFVSDAILVFDYDQSDRAAVDPYVEIAMEVGKRVDFISTLSRSDDTEGLEIHPYSDTMNASEFPKRFGTNSIHSYVSSLSMATKEMERC